MRRTVLLALFLSSCAAQQSHWQFDSLSTGQAAFDSSRIQYIPDDPMTGLGLELTFTSEGEIIGYLTSPQQPLAPTMSIRCGSETSQLKLSLHEGNMRTRLPDYWTETIIQTLAKGQEVDMIVGSIKQTIRPELFSSLYEPLKKRRSLS